MGIKVRGNSVAFYRSRRVGGRVVSEYAGSGLLAQVMALDAAADREEKARRLAERRAGEADLAATREVLGEIDRAVRLAIEAAGYRRHNRGEWRRIRGGREMFDGRTITEEQFAVMKRANKGDKAALPALHEAMDRCPRIVERFGDLATKAREHVLDAAFKTDLLSIEAIDHRMDEIRADLAGPNPTAIERMLAERASFCWAKLYLAEMVKTAGKPLNLAEYHDRDVERLHRQYVGSLKALAQVRKLDLTAIQVNVEQLAVVAGAGG